MYIHWWTDGWIDRYSWHLMFAATLSPGARCAARGATSALSLGLGCAAELEGILGGIHLWKNRDWAIKHREFIYLNQSWPFFEDWIGLKIHPQPWERSWLPEDNSSLNTNCFVFKVTQWPHACQLPKGVCNLRTFAGHFFDFGRSMWPQRWCLEKGW